MPLSQRFDTALAYASDAHRGHERKGKDVPYIAHLLAVASLALEFGANEDEAIAALLHDVVEDCGGEKRLADVQHRFGANVAAIVLACSDSVEGEATTEKAPWRQRKETYIGSVAEKSASARLVSLADKIHNASDILRDCRLSGVDQTFARFTGGKAGTLWYYRSLVDAFRSAGTKPELVGELDRVVKELEDRARES